MIMSNTSPHTQTAACCHKSFSFCLHHNKFSLFIAETESTVEVVCIYIYIFFFKVKENFCAIIKIKSQRFPALLLVRTGDYSCCWWYRLALYTAARTCMLIFICTHGLVIVNPSFDRAWSPFPASLFNLPVSNELACASDTQTVECVTCWCFGLRFLRYAI